MNVLISIDPGNKMGIAIFKNGDLSDCGLLRTEKLRELEMVMSQICAEVMPTDAVIEIPRVYDRRYWKGDPNDLVQLAKQAGVVMGVILKCCDVQEYYPQDWKGQRPKDVDNQYTLSLLSEKEKDVLKHAKIPASYRHNVIDAIGIGLKRLGRR